MLKQYSDYRKINRSLNNKIIKFGNTLEENIFHLAAKQLDIIQHNSIELAGEEEAILLTDFAIHDCKINGRNIVELYKQQHKKATGLEKDLLEAMKSARTSLFRVTDVSKTEHKLKLVDVLNNYEVSEIIDIGLSQTIHPDYLLFARIFKCKDLNMTSGVPIIFNKSERMILEQYQLITSKLQITDINIQRFVAFFKINRKEGVNVTFII